MFLAEFAFHQILSIRCALVRDGEFPKVNSQPTKKVEDCSKVDYRSNVPTCTSTYNRSNRLYLLPNLYT